MSPRRTSPITSDSRSTSPYPQASGSSKKSKKREQFSACGACRMRRVRCDLKDLPATSTGQTVSCTNCKERGIKCVDEFAEVKAVKQLRRGRRLQQAEAAYGKVPPELASLRSVTPPQNVTPRLAPEFFDSAFFWRFQIQRPILEPLEFRERYHQFINGNPDALQVPGQLIAMALVVWAASFGVNEYGVEDPLEQPANIRQRKEVINEMLQEILYLVDVHGILRKASWDGVRLLLLLLPLTQEIQSPMDRLVMYEATLSQVYNLTSLASATTVNSGQGEFIDALVRARVFWYAHIVDGVTSGLRGGRIWLSGDDLASFQGTLPARTDSSPGCSIYLFTFRYIAVPLRISSVARIIHTALTGPKAKQTEGVKEDLLHEAWDSLDRCWHDLDDLRKIGTAKIIEVEDMERFIHGWQIFIFECHNVVREALKQKLDSALSRPAAAADPDTGMTVTREGLTRLHEKARDRCFRVVHEVVKVIQRNLGSSFFQFDAHLVRDGCFFAAFLLAGENGSSNDVETCLQALNEMRWVFSKSEERMQTVRMIWQARLQRSRGDLSYPRKPPARALTMPSLSIATGPTARSPTAAAASLAQDASWPPRLAPSTGSLQAQSEPPTHRGSPVTSRTPPYASTSQVAGVARGSAAKAPLLAPPSVLLSPTLGAMRPIEDPAYYYGAYGFSAVGEGPSHASASSLAGGSAGALHLAGYTAAPAYHADGGVPFANPAARAATMLPATSAVEEDEDGQFVPTDRYY